MDKQEVEKIEIDLLLTALHQRYGYDFQHYTKATIRRRVRHFLAQTVYQQVSEMIPPLLHDDAFARSMIYDFSITVTEMFRDPGFYKAVRTQVIPYLKTYPFIKVWHVGCATGEEVYSLAILLQEEGLYDRVTIFATDFNDDALQKAEEGIYSLEQMRQYTINYQKAAGSYSFANYYHAQYDHARMDASLKRNMTFANHNLVTDSVFSEMHLIFCRNVLIYFDKELQNRVLTLLDESLAYSGFLCLGTKETLRFSEVNDHFRVIDEKARIYQKHVM